MWRLWSNLVTLSLRGAEIAASLWQEAQASALGRLLSAASVDSAMEAWQVSHFWTNFKWSLCENGAADAAPQSRTIVMTARKGLA
jgi:hypothetical protein